MSFSEKDPGSDPEISEDSLRLALERLGSGTAKRSAATTQRKPSSDQRRRRFVQEGQVVVEHHQPSRAAMRAPVTVGEDQGEELSRLRNLLRLEQRRAEDVQRELSDLQGQQRTLETHLMHEKLHVTELEKKGRESAQLLHEAQIQITQLREEALMLRRQLDVALADAHAVTRRARGPGRPRRVELADPTGQEPEPVQWWKD
ncbi:hypothetical protein [Swaminathania salitolerans]|uniref:hypothetical protein n=1 Tax=Swaminathania salitolerans TaxID=182838 RepID=UPI0011BF34D2|nr:hypothetical protein [Swaminathania salitolerans]